MISPYFGLNLPPLAPPAPPCIQAASVLFFAAALFGDQLVVRILLARGRVGRRGRVASSRGGGRAVGGGRKRNPTPDRRVTRHLQGRLHQKKQKVRRRHDTAVDGVAAAR